MTVTFKQRSCQKELLDGTGIPFAAIRQNMHELDLINARLGGHAVTLKGVKKLLSGLPKNTAQPYHIVEIGSGGGDNLRVIKQWAQKQNIKMQFTGIDINDACTAYAQQKKGNGGIQFICSDYREVLFDPKPHIVFNSLFCHHFTGVELVQLLGWMKAQSSIGFFINDLHRHPLAYHSIRLLTKAFSKSYLVKNDAPLSVLRGFTRSEWKALLKKADLITSTCHWQWAFRWLVVYAHGNHQRSI